MQRPSARRIWVLAHRYVGLFMAGFLILEGLTGSVLAFEGPIAQWLAPQTFAAPHPARPPLPLGILASKVEATETKAQVGFFSIDGRQASFSMLPRTDPATGSQYALDFDHLIVDPWSGRALARFRHGDLSQGPVNIVPFIYDLHQNLAIGPWGTILLGVVAVLWTADCFVAAYLTLPVPAGRFLPHWGKAWVLKWPSSTFRLMFDIHRAGGLWLWAVCFVFAWSSVMFTLPDQVYAPVTKALFRYDSDADTLARMSRRPQISTPRLTWIQAQAQGETLMAELAARYRFKIIRPYGMAYIPGWNVYTYAVDCRDNILAHGWGTSLWLDGNSGQLVEADIAATRPTGNTVDLWLRALHFGDLRDSWLYRTAVFLFGFAAAVLSGSGVYIWWRKRQSRRSGNARRSRLRPRPPQA